MRISDWSSDVGSSDLHEDRGILVGGYPGVDVAESRGSRQSVSVLCTPARDRSGVAGPRHGNISGHPPCAAGGGRRPCRRFLLQYAWCRLSAPERQARPLDARWPPAGRSEEHTSELQSLMRISYAVFCLKKKKHK